MLGISPDTPKAQLKFKEKHDLPYTLLADDKKEVAKKFDVLKEKNMYGKKVMGIVRTHIFDRPRRQNRPHLQPGQARRTRRGGAGAGEEGVDAPSRLVTVVEFPVAYRWREPFLV